MKKLLLLALTLLFSVFSFGQLTKIETTKPIKETKVGPMGTFWAGANFYQETVDFTFADTNYKVLDVFERFTLTNKDVDDLYKLLVETDSKVDDFYNLTTIDGKNIYILFSKSFGVVYPNISITNKAGVKSQFPNLTKSQWKKLLGKK